MKDDDEEWSSVCFFCSQEVDTRYRYFETMWYICVPCYVKIRGKLPDDYEKHRAQMADLQAALNGDGAAGVRMMRGKLGEIE